MKNRYPLFSLMVTVILSSCSADQTTFLKHVKIATMDRGVTVEEARDSGFIITGYTTVDSSRHEDVLLVRADARGDTLWTKTFGGNQTDNGWAVRHTADGGYIITGYTASFGAGGMDIYLLRMDISGDTLWTKTFGGPGDEFGWDIRRTTDNGFIIAAQTSSSGNGEVDAYLVKINEDGNEVWANTYGGDKVDRIFSVRQTPDGGYVAAGITYSFGEGDREAYLLKTTPSGEMEWFKTFGGPAYDVGHAIALTDDGGYLITGYGESHATHGKRDVYLIKTDGDGTLQWLKTHGSSENERAMKGLQTKDGGYIAIGFMQKPRPDRWDWDAYLIKTDATGDTLWTRTYGDDRHHETGYTVQETGDGGYILTGQAQSLDDGDTALLLIKTDHEGNLLP